MCKDKQRQKNRPFKRIYLSVWRNLTTLEGMEARTGTMQESNCFHDYADIIQRRDRNRLGTTNVCRVVWGDGGFCRLLPN